MPGSIKYLTSNELPTFLKAIDDMREKAFSIIALKHLFVMTLCKLSIVVVFVSLLCLPSFAVSLIGSEEVKQLSPRPITRPVILIADVRFPDDGVAGFGGELGYYPIFLGNSSGGAGEYIGFNIDYSQTSPNPYSLKKFGLGISYLGISFGFGKGTVWLYTNELIKGNRTAYFNSLAFELFALVGGVGVELTQFNYDELKLNDGIAAKYYFKIGLPLILY